MSKRRVGWLIPEWPGPSHTFFRRELDALRMLGVEAEVFSTRRRSVLPAHAWAQEAAMCTTYLHPASFRGTALALKTMLRAGPTRWARCLAAVAQADVPKTSDRIRLLALLFFGAELAGYLSAERLEHVHVQLCSDTAHVAMFANLFSGVSYSISHHEYLKEFGPNQRQKWRRAAFGHTISQVHLEELKVQLAGDLPNDLVVAPMGIEPSCFSRTAPYEPWTGAGEFVIFCCGRQTPGKNQEVLLHALHGLRSQGINAVLKLAGTDDSETRAYGKKLEALREELGLEEHVVFLGSIAEEQVKEMLQASHAFALASLHEGVSVAVMEAMSMELPVVVTRVGGMGDLVSSGVDGILVEANSADDMQKGLATVANSPESARAMGKLARRKVVEQFHSGVSAKVLAEAFDRHLGG